MYKKTVNTLAKSCTKCVLYKTLSCMCHLRVPMMMVGVSVVETVWIEYMSDTSSVEVHMLQSIGFGGYECCVCACVGG